MFSYTLEILDKLTYPVLDMAAACGGHIRLLGRSIVYAHVGHVHTIQAPRDSTEMMGLIPYPIVDSSMCRLVSSVEHSRTPP
ncbi:hypothetical protein RSOLAG1IB_01083 [Rhizoctonia solani AG-1 IB]|uniref:Uncharacterized protein n=1 Tax=Thanatephorus cucumeris (strain AG1-IB / isolate 7/3/14) TaxID=1108050 RepID=A0A0B7FC21_THACB|nr:hypothetical protein RSOLAG1IB_01083 [Rhizoctonia solani AG-1 IB]